MALSLFSPDFSGMTALAGKSVGNMGYPLFNVESGVEGAVERDKILAQYAQMQKALELQDRQNEGLLQRQNIAEGGATQRVNLTNQNALDLANTNNLFQGQQNKHRLDFDYSQLAQQGKLGQEQNKINMMNANTNALTAENTGNYQQGMLDVSKQQMITEQEKAKADMMAKHLDYMMNMEKTNLNKIGALASMYTASIKNGYLKTPEQQQQGVNRMLDKAVQLGLFSNKEEAGKALGTDPMDVLQNAQYYQALAFAAVEGKNEGLASGNNYSIGADGSIQVSEPLPKELKNDVLKDINNTTQQLSLIQDLRDKYIGTPEKPGVEQYDTFKQKALSNTIGEIENRLDINTGPGTYADQQAKLAEWNAAAENLKLNMMSGIQGFRPSPNSEKIANNIIIKPGDDVVIKKAKMDTAERLAKIRLEYNQKIYKTGIPLNPIENNKLNQEIEKIGKDASIIESDKTKTYSVTNKKGEKVTLSDADIANIPQVKSGKITIEQAKAHLGVK